MPQIPVNSANINTFGFTCSFDLYNRRVIFDTTNLTTYNGSGISNVLGISFALTDSDGVELCVINWAAPQLPTPATQKIYTLDLSYVNFAFLFQTYSIVGAIKDSTGIIYSTPLVYKTVCQPVGITDSGYVDGIFQLTPDCVNNSITVKELTLLIYNNQKPSSVAKTGTLYYPTGTISPVTFTGTPFANNYIVTGEYRIVCTTVGIYDLGDNVYVDVSYITDCPFPVTCADRMADILCCIAEVQQTKISNCTNAIGQRAAQQIEEITPSLLIGLLKEINGQDASAQAIFIRKTLNCNCGATSVHQNELNPVNPSVYSIVLTGVGGTTVPAAVQNGSTKTYTIASNVYSIAKGNNSDLAWTITTDTSVPYNTKYVITFNYTVMAGYILTAIANDPTLLTQLNSLITGTTNIDLSNLDGACIIDLSSLNYFLSFLTPDGSAVVKNIVIGSTTHNAPANLLVSQPTSIVAWLNGLSLGVYQASYATGVHGSYINILSNNNTHSPVSITLTISGSDTVVYFQKTSTSLIALLQALIDYMCNLTALQVALGNQLYLCFFDYNGNIIEQGFPANEAQANFNYGVSSAICSLVSRIAALTSVTCAQIRALFQDFPNTPFSVNGRFYGTLTGAECASITDQQAAMAIIGAIYKYSDVKELFCAINCATPASCPDVAAINMAMSGSSIGIYGVTWTQTPLASQTVTVKYRVNGSLTWIVATNALVINPSGNVSSNPPYLILHPTAGLTYDVQIINNCGGTGFIGQIAIPTGTSYPGSYLVNAILYNLCGSSPITLYSGAPFGTGVTMYTDAGLTTTAIGYYYIAPVSSGEIFNMNHTTAVVGSDTGNACNNGTGGIYIVGNNTGTICAGSNVTLYTNGAFAVGKTLYIDAGLTTPLTGFSYVVNNADGHIYNVNSSTGAILSDTGLSCSVNGSVDISNNSAGASITAVNNISGFSLSAPVNNGDLKHGTHTGFTATIPVVIAGTFFDSTLFLTVNSTIIQSIDVPAAATYTFSSRTYAATDHIEIGLVINL